MVREGDLCTSPGSSAIPPYRAGDLRGRWRSHTRVQESEFGGGVAGRGLGKLAQMWNALLRDAFSKHFRSGVPSTAIGHPHVRKWTKCHWRSRTELDNVSFEKGPLSIDRVGAVRICAEPGNQGCPAHSPSGTDGPGAARSESSVGPQWEQAGGGPGRIVR